MGLGKLVDENVLSEKDASNLRGSVGNNIPIIVVGKTATGKTTLARSIISEINSEFSRAIPQVIAWGSHEYFGEDKENNISSAHISSDFNDFYRDALRMIPEAFLVDEINRDDLHKTLRSFADAGGFLPVVGVLHGDVSENDSIDTLLPHLREILSSFVVVETSRDEDGKHRAQVKDINV